VLLSTNTNVSVKMKLSYQKIFVTILTVKEIKFFLVQKIMNDDSTVYSVA